MLLKAEPVKDHTTSLHVQGEVKQSLQASAVLTPVSSNRFHDREIRRPVSRRATAIRPQAVPGDPIFEERSKEHERYGGDPEQPHKLHVVIRVKSSRVPVIHKNTPAVNNLLKFVKHLVSIQPLKTPYGLPAEEDMADSYINSRGELIVRRLLKPVEPRAIES
ncbi:hypothetical protein CRUP_021081 [Coryphaenoides rupestris]|nr:hypothetical protein CRUP_021081 [Coryphaenoides rupestris]